jgi:uncharacterized protein (TIGR00251 family)
VRVRVRLTPRAHADRIDGVAGTALKVSVIAPPVDNRANEAVLRLLAREWRLPRRDLSIAAGGKSRDKSVQIAGNPATLMARLDAAIREKIV